MLLTAGSSSYSPFTRRAAFQLTSAHTWAAAIMPCLVGGALAIGLGYSGVVFEALSFLAQGGSFEALTATLPLGDAASLSAAAGTAGGQSGAAGAAGVSASLSAAAAPASAGLSGAAGGLPSMLLDCARATGAWLLILVTAVLLQSAVNTLNDYTDFLSGTDTAETVLDETDASIVYNRINPRSALRFALGLMSCAALTGLGAVLLSGWPLLIFGVLAAGIVVLYSAGPKPISFLPLGELVSGLTMGLFITGAAYYAITLSFSPWVLAASLPPVVTIALIMQTNNTCDIERDLVAGRRTLPILLGRTRSQRLAGLLAWGTLAWMALLSLLLWPLGVLVVALAAFVLRPRLTRSAHGPYDLVNRRVMMGNITSVCRSVNLVWTLAILSGALLGGFATGGLL